ncbi:MAG TPA: hypothetical protein ENG89_01800, partial [Candidatus Moranbacteria bacterium]|nr:hypothetical protein [Candidatus Moranbacteria bacterium]
MEDKINKPKKIPIVGIIILTVFLSATTGTFFGFMAGGIGKAVFSKVAEKLNLADKKDNENVEIQREIVIQEDSAIIDVVEKSSSAAVSIVITKDVPRFRSFFDGPFSFEFFSNPFRSQGEPETETRKVGGGSGFFISEDGMIVTNKHVVEDTDANYTVVTSDGKEFSASILAQHPLLDIALLDIKGDNFSALKLGDSDNLKVGQTVIAIGNP